MSFVIVSKLARGIFLGILFAGSLAFGADGKWTIEAIISGQRSFQISSAVARNREIAIEFMGHLTIRVLETGGSSSELVIPVAIDGDTIRLVHFPEIHVLSEDNEEMPIYKSVSGAENISYLHLAHRQTLGLKFPEPLKIVIPGKGVYRLVISDKISDTHGGSVSYKTVFSIEVTDGSSKEMVNEKGNAN